MAFVGCISKQFVLQYKCTLRLHILTSFVSNERLITWIAQRDWVDCIKVESFRVEIEQLYLSSISQFRK